MGLSKTESYATAKAPSFVRFILADEQSHFFPYAQFLHLHYLPSDGVGEGSQDQLRMMFSTHDVLVRGRCLEKLAEAFQKVEIEWVNASPERFAALNPDRPTVADIRVTERKE